MPFHALAVLVLLAAHLPEPSRSQSSATRDSMMGVWCGTANVVVNWTVQKKLGVRLVVPASGEITGNVGDARLSQGRLKANRGAVGRMLNMKTDYIVVGNLEGPIIAAEGITRRTVKMPLNWTGSELR